MARYTLTLALPAGFAKATAADLSSALGQVLLQLGAEVVKSSRWQLVADDVSNAEEPIRMIFCWSKPANAEQAVEVGVELICRELMGSGAPRTQGAIDRLLKSLSEQIPGLRVLSDSRSPVAKLAALISRGVLIRSRQSRPRRHALHHLTAAVRSKPIAAAGTPM